MPKPDSKTGPVTAKSISITRYVPTCRICRISKDNSDVYNWITTKVLTGESFDIVADLLTEYMQNKGIVSRPIRRKTLWTHYRNHVSKDGAFDIKMAKNGDDALLVSMSALDIISKEKFDEYKELCELYVRFKEVHNLVYLKQGSLEHKTDPTEKWSQPKIQSYVSMINTQKSILCEIAKMRQGDKLISVAAKFVIENLTGNLISKLSEEFATLANIMKRQGVSKDILNTFNETTHSRLARIIVDEAESTMNQTQKEFKLPQ